MKRILAGEAAEGEARPARVVRRRVGVCGTEEEAEGVAGTCRMGGRGPGVYGKACVSKRTIWEVNATTTDEIHGDYIETNRELWNLE